MIYEIEWERVSTILLRYNVVEKASWSAWKEGRLVASTVTEEAARAVQRLMQMPDITRALTAEEFSARTLERIDAIRRSDG